jgi:hypothetical protein
MFLKRMNVAGLGNRISSPFHIYKNESIYLVPCPPWPPTYLFGPYIFIKRMGPCLRPYISFYEEEGPGGKFRKRMGPE